MWIIYFPADVSFIMIAMHFVIEDTNVSALYLGDKWHLHIVGLDTSNLDEVDVDLIVNEYITEDIQITHEEFSAVLALANEVGVLKYPGYDVEQLYKVAEKVFVDVHPACRFIP